MRKNVVSVAFCGIMAALCLVTMILSGVIQIATIALPALAGIFLMAVVIEADAKWALCVYAAVSVLSFILVADKEAVLIFVLFFGYYPIIKVWLDRIRQKLFRWIVKLLIFNAAAISEYLLAAHVFGVPQEEYQIGGFSVLGILLLLANLVFVMYDILLLRLVAIYFHRIRPKLAPILKRK